MSIWFQAVNHTSALQSGVKLLALVVSLLVASFLAGIILTKMKSLKLVQCSAAISVLVGISVLSTIESNPGPAIWFPSLLLIGIGAGAGVSCPFLSVSAALSQTDISSGMAFLTFSQEFGEAISAGAAQSLFLNTAKRQLQTRLPGINAEEIIEFGITGYTKRVSQSQEIIVAQCYNDAVGHTFYIGIAMAVCMTFAGVVAKTHERNDD